MSWRSGTEPRRPWSLAARLTAWYAGSAFALVLAATAVLHWALVQNLDREDEQELRGQVRVLRAVLRGGPADPAAVRREVEWAWAARQTRPVHVRIRAAGGGIVAETPGMAALLPPEVFPPPITENEEPGEGRPYRPPGGRPFRLVAARAAGPGGAGYVVQVALDQQPEDELLVEYRRTVWVVLAAALALCTVVGYRMDRRGVRPLAQITATARRVGPAALGERIDPTYLPAELHELARTFNGMLGRLEGAFDRLARFSADIAHELRTPLGNLRGGVEVALARPRGPEEYRETLGSALEECDRLARMIDALLFLARAEDPRTQVRSEPLELGKELAAVCEFYEAAAAEAGVHLEMKVPARLDRALLQRALGNLVANALAHTPPGGTITLSATAEAGGVRITVADTGCGVAAEHLPYLFDRFYRVDRARPSADGPAGPGDRQGDRRTARRRRGGREHGREGDAGDAILPGHMTTMSSARHLPVILPS